MQSPQAKIPGNRCLHVRIDRDVAALIQGDQLPEGGRIGGEADEDEDPVRGKLPRGPRLDVLQADPLDQVETVDRLDDGVPGEGDLFVGEGPLLEDRRRPQAVPPVDDRHLLRKAGEVERLLDGRVAAADDRDLPVSVEGAVAGGAEGDPLPDEPLLARARRDAASSPPWR